MKSALDYMFEEGEEHDRWEAAKKKFFEDSQRYRSLDPSTIAMIMFMGFMLGVTLMVNLRKD